MITPVMADHALLLLAALVLGGTGLALLVLRPRDRELRLPREEEGLEFDDSPIHLAEEKTIDLIASEAEPDRRPAIDRRHEKAPSARPRGL